MQNMRAGKERKKMRMRSAYARMSFSGLDVTATIHDESKSLSYIDNASGTSDTIALSMVDPTERWIGPWMPSKGDRIRGFFGVESWAFDGDNRMLDAGLFVVDSLSYSGGMDGINLSIGAVSQPADQGFMSEKRSKTWKDVTIEEIQSEIAERYGLSYFYDAKEIKIKTKTQSKQTDSEFLAAITKEYGLALKVYSEKIVIFDQNEYMRRPPVAIIDKMIMESWTSSVELVGSYTGAQVSYNDPTTEECTTYIFGQNGRMLKINQKCDSLADAQMIAKAAVFEANHGNMNVSFSIMGNPSIVASQVIAITGLGRFDGNYYIDKITHSLSGNYTCKYECSNVNNENSEASEATESADGPGTDKGGSTHEERMNAIFEGTDYAYNPSSNPSGLLDASSGAVRF